MLKEKTRRGKNMRHICIGTRPHLENRKQQKMKSGEKQKQKTAHARHYHFNMKKKLVL